ncbi:hypothetical protein Anapl_18018 [Anas platyrhynchos]|uniref:Talin-1 n=1 Tax=Anas platyrhynchos TaxID=8839 RepID=R0JI91_ANAPL|nr:hypothetical protein Anapl_18018 [Anas platyrhynchos]
MASTQLTPVLATASAATSRGVKALEGLANALGKPEEMPKAQEEAEEAVAEAERTLRRLDQVQMATLATKAAEEPGLEATSIYRALEAFTKARVEELEREQKRNRRQSRSSWWCCATLPWGCCCSAPPCVSTGRGGPGGASKKWWKPVKSSRGQ